MSEEFPDTRWSQLLELKDRDHPRYAEQLDRLARQYWKPVWHYIRALRPGGEADDLTQQFFAMLLGRRDLEKLSPERGSFRGFLKTALRHFLTSQDRAVVARAPREGALLFRFGEAEAEWKKADPGVTPDEAFDREWARGILVEAVARLRREMEAADRADQFGIFREYCLDEAEVSYEDLARARGVGADDVRNRLRETRQRLREVLREMLKDYLDAGEDVEAELRWLLR